MKGVQYKHVDLEGLVFVFWINAFRLPGVLSMLACMHACMHEFMHVCLCVWVYAGWARRRARWRASSSRWVGTRPSGQVQLVMHSVVEAPYLFLSWLQSRSAPTDANVSVSLDCAPADAAG